MAWNTLEFQSAQQFERYFDYFLEDDTAFVAPDASPHSVPPNVLPSQHDSDRLAQDHDYPEAVRHLDEDDDVLPTITRGLLDVPTDQAKAFLETSNAAVESTAVDVSEAHDSVNGLANWYRSAADATRSIDAYESVGYGYPDSAVQAPSIVDYTISGSLAARVSQDRCDSPVQTTSNNLRPRDHETEPLVYTSGLVLRGSNRASSSPCGMERGQRARQERHHPYSRVSAGQPYISDDQRPWSHRDPRSVYLQNPTPFPALDVDHRLTHRVHATSTPHARPAPSSLLIQQNEEVPLVLRHPDPSLTPTIPAAGHLRRKRMAESGVGLGKDMHADKKPSAKKRKTGPHAETKHATSNAAQINSWAFAKAQQTAKYISVRANGSDSHTITAAHEVVAGQVVGPRREPMAEATGTGAQDPGNKHPAKRIACPIARGCTTTFGRQNQLARHMATAGVHAKDREQPWWEESAKRWDLSIPGFRTWRTQGLFQCPYCSIDPIGRRDSFLRHLRKRHLMSTQNLLKNNKRKQSKIEE